MVGEGIARGLLFEVCYAPAIRDVSRRRHLFGNLVPILRATRGKSVVVSSGCAATDLASLRSPLDVVNLAFALGMDGDAPSKCVFGSCKRALEHAATRKHTASAVAAVSSTLPEAGWLQQDFIRL